MKPLLLALLAVLMAYGQTEEAVRVAWKHASMQKKSVRLAAGCEFKLLQPGETVKAVLNSTDCPFSAYLPGAPEDLPVNLYRFVAEAPSVVTFDIGTSAFQPGLFIANEYGALLSADETGGEDGAATASIHVAPGTYHVVATSHQGTGEYTIGMNSEAPRTCVAIPLAVGSEINGAFDHTDCRLIDLAIGETNVQPLESYSFESTAKGALALSYISAEAQAFMVLLDAKGELVAVPDYGGLIIESLASIPSGAYKLHVMAMPGTDRGSYKLRTSSEGLRECRVPNLNSGATISGALSEEDCRYLDIFVPSSDASPADRWALAIEEPSIVTLTLRSGEFDPVLSVISSAGELIGWNRTFDGTNRATLTLGLARGSYEALAGTASSGGAYSIDVRRESPRKCDILPLPIGTAMGMLEAAGCRSLDLTHPSTDIRATQAYSFSVSELAVYTFQLRSTTFVPTLAIFTASGTRIGELDALEGVLSLRVLLAPGEYRLQVLAYEGAGAYELTTAISAPSACPIAAEIGVDQPFGGELELTDCGLNDLIPGMLLETRSDWLKLVVSQPGIVTLQATSQQFPPMFWLLDERKTVLETAQNTGFLPQTGLTRALEPGVYFVAVASVTGAEGSYRLTTAVQPSSK